MLTREDHEKIAAYLNVFFNPAIDKKRFNWRVHSFATELYYQAPTLMRQRTKPGASKEQIDECTEFNSKNNINRIEIFPNFDKFTFLTRHREASKYVINNQELLLKLKDAADSYDKDKTSASTESFQKILDSIQNRSPAETKATVSAAATTPIVSIVERKDSPIFASSKVVINNPEDSKKVNEFLNGFFSEEKYQFQIREKADTEQLDLIVLAEEFKIEGPRQVWDSMLDEQFGKPPSILAREKADQRKDEIILKLKDAIPDIEKYISVVDREKYYRIVIQNLVEIADKLPGAKPSMRV